MRDLSNFRRIETDANGVPTVRIVGFTLYLSIKDPSKSTMVAEVVLQSVGVSLLLLELSLTLLRWYIPLLFLLLILLLYAFFPCIFLTLFNNSGHAGLEDETRTTYPKIVERVLKYTRLPILLAVV